MEAALLKLRLSAAIRANRPFVLLLRGAHSLEIDNAILESSDVSGPFDIAGLIAIDGTTPRQGTVTVTSEIVTSLFVEHDKESA